MNVNVVSNDTRFCRLLELELSHLGLCATVTEHPTEESAICLMDADTCQLLPPSPHTVLILFGKTALDELALRAAEQLSKPFLLTELRRVIAEYMFAKKATSQRTNFKRSPTYRGTSLTFHHKTRSVTVGNSKPIALSQTEYNLLCRMKEFGEKPLSAKDVTDIIGDRSSNEFNVYICYLRRKLEHGNLRLIHTVRGKGYTLHPQERKKL